MRLRLLGTGDAAGIPLYGCQCERCTLARQVPQHRRGPTCALLEVEGKRYLIDAGLTDIAEKFPATTLDGIFLTHFHPDHVQGLFHLRWGIGEKIPVYCPPDSIGCGDLFKHSGIIDFQVQKKYQSIKLDCLEITPVPLIHSKPTFGYIFESKGQRLAYLVDTKGIPPRLEQLLQDMPLDTLVIDTCSPPGVENRNHNNLDDTLLLHHRIGVKKTIMTHINHEFDLWLSNNPDSLPDGIFSGYDECVIGV